MLKSLFVTSVLKLFVNFVCLNDTYVKNKVFIKKTNNNKNIVDKIKSISESM